MRTFFLSSKIFIFGFIFAVPSLGKKVEGEASISTDVSYIEGNVLWRKNNQGSSRYLSKADTIPPEVRVFCREKAKLLLNSGPRNLRFLSGSTFVAGPNTLMLWDGALLFDQRAKQALRSPPFHLSGPEVEIVCSGRGTMMTEVVTSGGIKVIGLAGSLSMRRARGENSILLRPGELRFVKPFGRGFGELINLNLQTLVSTAALIHEFPNDVSFENELAKAVLEQRSLVTKRYRAQVGDSSTPETFELRPLRKVKNTHPSKP